MCTFTTLINTVLKVLATAIRQENKIKHIQIEKEDCLYLQMTWLYNVENPKKTTKKLLGLSEFSMIIGYKFNIPKPIVLLYGFWGDGGG